MAIAAAAVDVGQVISVVVTVASLLANVVPAHTIVGKALNWFAFNFRRVSP